MAMFSPKSDSNHINVSYISSYVPVRTNLLIRFSKRKTSNNKMNIDFTNPFRAN